MLRVTAAVATALSLAALGGGPAAEAASPEPSPPANCNILVAECAAAASTPGSAASKSASGPRNSKPASPCAAWKGVQWVEVPCTSSSGTWSTSLQCYLRQQTPQPPLDEPVWAGNTTGVIYLCTTPLTPSTRLVRLPGPAAAAPTPAQLAQQALSTLRLPKPVVQRSPLVSNSDNGVPYTWVNTWTWWWTTPAIWRTRTATARAGAAFATVTVTPTRLVVEPGDGSPAVTCPGAGRPWTPADADAPPTGGGCANRYTRVTPSGPLTATVSVDWTVTWTGSGGTSGVLPGLRTSNSTSFIVQQIQAVNT